MSTISVKEKANVVNYLQQIAAKTFDQETLKSLLISIRESVPPNSPTKEMANFVAHSDRNKGQVLEHLKGFLEKTVTLRSGQHITALTLMRPKDGYLLIDDLATVVSDLGLARQAIDDNREDLLLCYFGLLHLATVKDKLEVHTLKLSYTFRSKNNGSDPLLSIVSIDPEGIVVHIFYSNIEAKSILGSLKLIDADLNTMLRVTRDGHSLKIVQG